MTGRLTKGQQTLRFSAPIMNQRQLHLLLHQVAGGTVDPEAAEAQLLEALRAQPFEDLGFARVDHHRSVRTGFPEVILGLGKTPAQVAAIAQQIAARGSTLLITRASPEAFAAVRAGLPEATYYADAGIVALRQQDVTPGKGLILIVA